MRVTIGDLDYYYTKNKVNCFNPDAMKISSYHKQSGDQVLLVTTEDDINRPYDLYYMIKEKDNTPQPPTKFFLDPKVRWGGKAYRMRINWHMPDVMLACRSDYQLYPEKETKGERSEQVRLINNKMQLIEFQQNGSNSYSNKYLIVLDDLLGYCTSDIIIKALKMIEGSKKVSFFEPIGIQKIIYDKNIREQFLKLNFAPGSKLEWQTININEFEDALDFIHEFKEKFPHVSAGFITVDYRRKGKSHWIKENAIEDFNTLKQLICRCKKEEFKIKIRMPATRFETPYFELFETISEGTQYNFQESGLEFISKRFGRTNTTELLFYGNHIEKGDEVFRDLLRQTYEDKEFLLLRGKNDSISENDIPGKLGKDTFKLGG